MKSDGTMSLSNKLASLQKSITSREIWRALRRASRIFFLFFLLILLPYVLFVIQHLLTAHEGFYTYLDAASSVKGEPINILIKYNGSRIIERLKADGWKEVSTSSITNQSTWNFSLAKGITPISPRYFHGVVQRYALEGPKSTVFQRHHARFWSLHGSLYGTVSYDAGVTVVFQGILPIPTHIIDQDIDNERDALGKRLGKEEGLKLSYKDNTFPLIYKDNHAGSWFYTDGEILVLTKNPERETFFQKSMLSLRRMYFRTLGIILNLFS